VKEWFVLRLLPVVLGTLLLWNPSRVTAATPGDDVRQTVGQLLTILQNPELQGVAKSKERREKLREAIYPRFDFAEMAKRSLGSHWQRRTLQEQNEFVKVFTSLLESAYLDTIESYNGEKVRYLKEREDKDQAEVETKIVDNSGKEFSVNYRLHDAGGDWKVYDVLIENISLVNNYRSQFNRVIGKSSYEDLLLAMKEKKLSMAEKKS
jgi:phospholipid transport system substrate-binding protein